MTIVRKRGRDLSQFAAVVGIAGIRWAGLGIAGYRAGSCNRTAAAIAFANTPTEPP
ncbi:MAG: hypothetical protein ACRECP_05285 [Methylocella sp.]